jgi:DNA-binding NtrC family response regulator
VHRLLSTARRIEELSVSRWGSLHAVRLIGTHDVFARALDRVHRFAGAAGPVLITGETGTGKELFARALYLLSARHRLPFLSVNCAQYHDGQLLASELFGHRRGSFTGATADHRGVFEDAQGGVLFLDEIGELSVPAQAMLLRVLGEGEIVGVGETRSRRVDVRVIAATSRDLGEAVRSGAFRPDLYFRLKQLHVRVPALRERGDDWRHLINHTLEELRSAHGRKKTMGAKALALLSAYAWPGNVRELRGITETGYHLCDGDSIECCHFDDAIEQGEQEVLVERLLAQSAAPARQLSLFERLQSGAGDFWVLVHRPFLQRELRRDDVRAAIARGLDATRGSYKRLLPLFGVAASDYLRFMDFLRHHDLKPTDGGGLLAEQPRAEPSRIHDPSRHGTDHRGHDEADRVRRAADVADGQQPAGDHHDEAAQRQPPRMPAKQHGDLPFV